MVRKPASYASVALPTSGPETSYRIAKHSIVDIGVLDIRVSILIFAKDDQTQLDDEG
jgi:hypothetical protein